MHRKQVSKWQDSSLDLNMKVAIDYLITHQEDSACTIKRGWPRQKPPYLLIFVRYEEARRSGEYFRVIALNHYH